MAIREPLMETQPLTLLTCRMIGSNQTHLRESSSKLRRPTRDNSKLILQPNQLNNQTWLTGYHLPQKHQLLSL